MEKSSDTSTVSPPSVPASVFGAAALAQMLPQIAGFVVGVSALGYLIGLREATNYYENLGAPWAPSLLSVAKIAQGGASVLTTIVFFAVGAFWSFGTSETFARTLQRWWYFIFALAGVLAFGPILKGWGATWISEPLSKTMVIGSAYGLAAVAGISLAELVAQMGRDGVRWSRMQLLHLFFFVLLGIYRAPNEIGGARADRDTNNQTTQLPLVKLAHGSDGRQWRFVAATDNGLLLVALASDSKDRVFRLSEPKDVLEVSHPRK